MGGGLSKVVVGGWFGEPEGWLTHWIGQHREIRDDFVALFRAPHFPVRVTGAGSYLSLPPEMEPDLLVFVGFPQRQANVVVTPEM